MDAHTGTTIARTAQAGASQHGGPSAAGLPRTGPTAWSRGATGLRIPRHRAGACGVHQWIQTGDLR